MGYDGPFAGIGGSQKVLFIRPFGLTMRGSWHSMKSSGLRNGIIMPTEQISIFLENESGRLAEVTDLLARQGINIRALSLADTKDFGIFRLIVSDPPRALALLKASGFTATGNEVVPVLVPDRPGGLAGILASLKRGNINVEYMYAFVQRSDGNAVVIFRFDDAGQAVAALTAAGIRVLTGEEMRAL